MAVELLDQGTVHPLNLTPPSDRPRSDLPLSLNPSSPSSSLASLDSLPPTTAFTSPDSTRFGSGSSSSFSPSTRLPLPSFESARPSSSRPSPLTLETSNKTSHQQFLPRTSSRSSLPNTTTITAVGSERRTHSLASPLDRPCLVAPARLVTSGLSLGPAGALRRKPLANTASSLVSQSPISFHNHLPVYKEDEEESSSSSSSSRNSIDGLGGLQILDSLDSLDDFDELPRPDQRFTRSSFIDSPTLYEFPSQSQKTHQKHPLPSLLVPASLSVSKQPDSIDKGSPAAVPDSVYPETQDTDSEEGSPSSSRNSTASTPATPQTATTDVSAQHEKDLATNIECDQTHVRDPAEEELELVEPELPQEQNEGLEDENIEPTPIMSLFSRKPNPPQLSLGTVSSQSDNKDIKDITDAQKSPPRDSHYSYKDNTQSPGARNSTTTINTVTPTSANKSSRPNTFKPLPKSPVSSKLGNFFGWSPSTSTTEFSEREFSPLHSHYSLQPASTVGTHASTLSTSGTSITSAAQGGDYKRNSRNNTFGSNTHAAGDDLQTSAIIASQPQHLLRSLSPSSEIEEMEDELKAISAELASSIRREIDLEDLVERLQAEVSNPQAPGKRTSDYYSDSGYSSSRGFSDYDAAKEEISHVQRRAEQEKAQVRLELTQKLSDERTRRTYLDQQIKELSERAATLDLAQTQRSTEDVSGRVKQLEGACEDLRRRLAEERGVKENFEDLLSAMKGELQSATNERDNLRDEVVPQLRARVEGLESQAAELAQQAYETSKIQQELQTLKEENSNLRSISSSMTIAEEGEQEGGFKLKRAPSTLSRSNTVKRQQQQQQQQGAGGATAPSSTLNESREVLAERLRDVEAQRDALHNALKNLLDRQEFQNRENGKKVRVLELERDRLLTASPKKAGYEREVATLREEVSMLRHRAEDALEQKWQVEKGLSGLKMDLDRAEEEIASLRKLLQQSDILVMPSSRVVSMASSAYGEEADVGGPATSASLEEAYRNLQTSYSEALERIRALEIPSADGTSVAAISDESTAMAIRRLEQALAGTEADRDTAQSQLADAATAEASLLESERNLAEQLSASAERVTDLSQQVQAQLSANALLRERLTTMVARRESDQRFNKQRIVGLEARLRTLEEQLVATQTAAEDGVARHEEQVAALREAHSSQLQRLRDASGQLRAPSPRTPSPSPSPSPRTASRPFAAAAAGGSGGGGGGGGGGLLSPMSPMFAINGRLVPSRPSSRASSPGTAKHMSLTVGGGGGRTSPSVDADQQVQVSTLRARVGELEGALASADSELQEVVGRMNTAQIEVLQLQVEREQAARETRQLQRLLEAEQVKSFEERFRILGRSAAMV